MTDSKPLPRRAIERLSDEVVRQEETVAKLRSEGHVHADAERQLNQLKDRLAQFR